MGAPSMQIDPSRQSARIEIASRKLSRAFDKVERDAKLMCWACNGNPRLSSSAAAIGSNGGMVELVCQVTSIGALFSVNNGRLETRTDAEKRLNRITLGKAK